MADLKNPSLIYAKGLLFLAGGLLAAGVLVAEHPTIRFAFLLAVAVWCFCRAYYFAFYVIEHYVDPGFKFAGLGAFVRYLWSARRVPEESRPSAGTGLQSGSEVDRDHLHRTPAKPRGGRLL